VEGAFSINRARRGSVTMAAISTAAQPCLALPGGRSCPGAQPSHPRTDHSRPPRLRGTSEIP
jgi:hypothetical protein